MLPTKGPPQPANSLMGQNKTVRQTYFAYYCSQMETTAGCGALWILGKLPNARKTTHYVQNVCVRGTSDLHIGGKFLRDCCCCCCAMRCCVGEHYRCKASCGAPIVPVAVVVVVVVYAFPLALPLTTEHRFYAGCHATVHTV